MFKSSDEPMDRFEGLDISESLEECLKIGLICVDVSNQVKGFNTYAESLLDIRAREIIGKHFDELPKEIASLTGEAQKSGKNILHRQIVLTNSAKSTPVCEVSAYPISPDRDGNYDVILLIANRSLTQDLEDNLRRVDRLASVGSFSTAIAHEIKNAMQPLNTLIDAVFVKIRDQNLIQDSEDLKLIDIVARESHRITSLLSQMLRISKPAKLSKSIISGHKIILESLDLINYQIEEKQITLIKNLYADKDELYADPHQLEQAILNILINAIESMSTGGTLHVQTSVLEPEIKTDLPSRFKVTVHDSGIGIPPENMDKLFDTFFTTKSNGTGLGLAITRRILKEHLGNIEIQSSPNKGTTVSLILPLETSPATSPFA